MRGMMDDVLASSGSVSRDGSTRSPANGYVHAAGNAPLSRLLALPRPHMVGVEARLATVDVVDYVRSELGALAYVWTIEDARTAADALERGADVLATAAPDDVRRAVRDGQRRCQTLAR